MKKKREAILGYTLVQHSAYSYAGKAMFQHAVEEYLIVSKKEMDRVRKAGGLLFASYQEASDRAYKENYPNKDYKGIHPKVQGTFSTRKLSNLAIYLPKQAQEDVCQSQEVPTKGKAKKKA